MKDSDGFPSINRQNAEYGEWVRKSFAMGLCVDCWMLMDLVEKHYQQVMPDEEPGKCRLCHQQI